MVNLGCPWNKWTFFKVCIHPAKACRFVDPNINLKKHIFYKKKNTFLKSEKCIKLKEKNDFVF